jgi:uncharacterized protein YlxW (UPF0749 family)
MATHVRWRIPSWQLTLGVALLGLGFLVAAQLRSEVPRSQYSSSELPPLQDTARELQRAQDGLKSQIQDLRLQIQRAEQGAAGNNAAVSALNDDLERARLAAGLTALRGPGVVLRLADSTQPVPPDAAPADYLVSAADLRTVVDQLWEAGAEAISINGERIAISTAMTDIGTSVLVNSSYLQPPYEVSAIGPAAMWNRLTAAAGFVTFLQARVQAVGLNLGLARSDAVDVPAFSGSVNLVHAAPVASPAAGAGSPAAGGEAAP